VGKWPSLSRRRGWWRSLLAFWWPGAGSNRRPTAFQAVARSSGVVETTVFAGPLGLPSPCRSSLIRVTGYHRGYHAGYPSDPCLASSRSRLRRFTYRVRCPKHRLGGGGRPRKSGGYASVVTQLDTQVPAVRIIEFWRLHSVARWYQPVSPNHDLAHVLEIIHVEVAAERFMARSRRCCAGRAGVGHKGGARLPDPWSCLVRLGQRVRRWVSGVR
jgi:hypothetical protein